MIALALHYGTCLERPLSPTSDEQSQCPTVKHLEAPQLPNSTDGDYSNWVNLVNLLTGETVSWSHYQITQEESDWIRSQLNLSQHPVCYNGH